VENCYDGYNFCGAIICSSSLFFVSLQVMSADAFGAFEDVGLDNEEEVKKVGKKFKDTVLSLGGGVPPSEVFKQFRGRDPTPDALLRHNGLA
jgi:oligopeptidase A